MPGEPLGHPPAATGHLDQPATAAPDLVLAACSAVAAPTIATSTNGVALSSVSPFSTLISRQNLALDRPVGHHARADGQRQP